MKSNDDNFFKLTSPETGIVVIGRNEGLRLVNCLNRLKAYHRHLVYVDSGSNDTSIDFARSLGISVVELDKQIPFTAARARNEGFNHLLNRWPELEHVQFIDGDCEIENGWLHSARQHLEHNNDWAIVCGRNKERYPEKSVYNLLCDMEWDTPIGFAKSSGGNFMVRVSAFRSVKGFNMTLIAGEEPELGFRLREKGWKIRHLDYPMTIHDADITRFSQWWKKIFRGGYACAQGYSLHGSSRERYFLRETMRPWLWVVFLPAVICYAAIAFNPTLHTCFMIYPFQMFRVMVRQYKKTGGWIPSFWYAYFNMIGKLPELAGQIQFLIHQFLKKTPNLIEYK